MQRRREWSADSGAECMSGSEESHCAYCMVADAGKRGVIAALASDVNHLLQPCKSLSILALDGCGERQPGQTIGDPRLIISFLGQSQSGATVLVGLRKVTLIKSSPAERAKCFCLSHWLMQFLQQCQPLFQKTAAPLVGALKTQHFHHVLYHLSTTSPGKVGMSEHCLKPMTTFTQEAPRDPETGERANKPGCAIYLPCC